jgi:hypothetical protein
MIKKFKKFRSATSEMHVSKNVAFVLGALLWATDALHTHSNVYETGSSRNARKTASRDLSRLKLFMKAIEPAQIPTMLKLRGGIGEAMDGDTRPSRGISDGLETFESFGQGPTSLDQSSSRFEAKPDHFNQSENRMDGKSLLCL